ncbi:MAG: homocysteine S-methyltransferase [Acidimicrobiales bacterium]|nr:homocysteine S-methyltransferase [Acidimicrobiales bacterium]
MAPGPRAPLGDRVRVVDGGLGSTLEAAGADLAAPLWSAKALVEQPGLVQQVHESFFRAGADVAVTASYQVSEEGFEAAGRDGADARRALARSVEVARAAAEATGGDRLVAASVGPYGAVLADGSEYHGRYGLSAAELTAFHRRRLTVLEASGPDLLAIETQPTLAEAEAVLEALDHQGPPLWLTFTCVAGARTAGGDDLVEAGGRVASHPRVAAVGVNCTAADDVADALVALADTGLPLVACPNAGGSWDAEARVWRYAGTGALDPVRVAGWVAQGARLVGGCCGVGPDDIAALRRSLI